MRRSVWVAALVLAGCGGLRDDATPKFVSCLQRAGGVVVMRVDVPMRDLQGSVGASPGHGLSYGSVDFAAGGVGRRALVALPGSALPGDPPAAARQMRAHPD